MALKMSLGYLMNIMLNVEDFTVKIIQQSSELIAFLFKSLSLFHDIYFLIPNFSLEQC